MNTEKKLGPKSIHLGNLLAQVGDGMTTREYELIEDESVAPRMTVRDLVSEAINIGGFKWELDDQGKRIKLILAPIKKTEK